MGQRARRQLAEKQFGGSARHLSLSAASVAASGQPPAAAQPSHAATQRRGASGATVATPGRNPAVAEEALHPSWAAKRQQRGSLIVPAEGKKVVFGDDGVPTRVGEVATAGKELAGSDAAERRGERNGAVSYAGPPASRGSPRVLHRNGKQHSAGGLCGTKPAQAQAASSNGGLVVKGGVRFRAEGAGAPDVDAHKQKAASIGAGLHPSWAAKKLMRQQMERLPAPQGAKVVFQDSD